MNDFADFFKSLDIPEETLKEIAASAQTNPMAAMAAIQEHLGPETIQQLVAFLMSNPEALSQLAQMAQDAGIDETQLEQVKDQLAGE